MVYAYVAAYFGPEKFVQSLKSAVFIDFFFHTIATFGVFLVYFLLVGFLGIS